MVTYNIFGLNIDIPTAAEIVNAIISPVQSAVLSTIQNVISATQSAIYQVITPIVSTIQSIFAFLQGIPSQIISGIQSFVSTIITSITNLIPQILSIPNTIRSFLYSDIYLPISNGINSVLTSISSIPNYLQPVISQIQNLPNSIRSFFYSDIVTPLSNYIQPFLSEINFIGSAVSAIPSTLQSVAATIQNNISTAISNFGQGLINAITQFNNEVIDPILNDISNTFTNGALSLMNPIRDLLFNKVSDDPNVALEQLTSKAAAIGLSVVGTIAALKVAENIHPFHTLKLEEGFVHILEFVGVYDIGRETLKLFIDNGIGLQAEYALNYQFQAKKLNIQQAEKGVWYGVRTMDQLAIDARFEGFEDDAINTIKATTFRPMPPFILEKLMELALVDNGFSTKQLLRDGFDPADIPFLTQAFQNLALSGFQSNAKSLIFVMFKDGMIDEGNATKIMDAFAIPKNQQQWILQLATLQFQYEQKINTQTLILDDVAKGLYKDLNQAISDLSGLGIDPTKATLLVKIKATSSYFSLTAKDKTALVEQFGSFLTS